MDINDDVLSMPRGWVIAYNDGIIITEYDRNGISREWNKVSKKNIKYIALKWETKHWTIFGKENYLQKKRGWITPTVGVEIEPTIQYRYIGYWEGSNKVFYRVDEQTGEMKIEVEGPDGVSDTD